MPASKRNAKSKASRSYRLNEPDNFLIEEWPESKRALYEAARELFWEKGFSDTSVQEIVDGAKLTKGAFYHYFGAKSDLLRIMYEHSLERLLRNVQSLVTDDMPSRTAITTILEQMVGVVIEYRAEVAIFWEEYRRLPTDAIPNARERRRELTHFIAAVIDRGVKRGELVPVPSSTVTAISLLGLCHFVNHWYRPHGTMQPIDVAHFFAGTVLDGLAVRS